MHIGITEHSDCIKSLLVSAVPKNVGALHNLFDVRLGS